MRTLSLRMPDSLYRQARALATRDGLTFNQLVVLALAAKVHAELTDDERVARDAGATPDAGWADGGSAASEPDGD